MDAEIPASHPRYQSLLLRHRLTDGASTGMVAPAGLIAHGRGESLDYFLGEKSQEFSRQAALAAAAAFLEAKYPVISVNGNVAALCPEELVALSRESAAPLEVNLFYRTPGREELIADHLLKHGAGEILGVGSDADATIPEIGHERRRVSSRGIARADLVLVPLEDGDRTEALVKMGKTVITVDLNPLSRTAQKSQITMVDNVVRSLPLLCEALVHWKSRPPRERQDFLANYDNGRILSHALEFMASRLTELAKPGNQPWAEVTSDTPKDREAAFPYSLVQNVPAASLGQTTGLETFHARFVQGRKLRLLTAYDYPTAQLLSENAVDMLLVGDSLAMVFQGSDSTRNVTLQDMIYHTKAVLRGAGTVPVIVDLPAGSYNHAQQALESARQIMALGASGIKLEGCFPETISTLVAAGIPVMGHLGLLPQSAQDFRVQGKEESEAQRIAREAREIQKAGVFSLVLECIPRKLAAQISAEAQVPVIGIGAGPDCHGQILVTHDLIRLIPGRKPKFVPEYGTIRDGLNGIISRYCHEVEQGLYPGDKESYH